MKRFHYFGTVFVTGGDREAEKSGAEAVFVYATKSQRATRQSATLSRDKVADALVRQKLREKIAGVTAV